jgi:hypothetical protein
MTRRQAGFSVIEGVMALAIVALIGVVVWQAVKGHQKAVASSSQTPTSSSSVKDDPYSGWKTFNSTYEKDLSFKYPGNWVYKSAAGNEPGSDGLELTTPSGMVFRVWAGADGFGGACDPAECPNNVVYKSQPFNVKNYGTLYLQEWSEIQNDGTQRHIVGISDVQLHTAKDFPPYMMYRSKSHPDSSNIVVSFTSTGSYSAMNGDKFFSLAEVKTVEKIIGSWSY